MGFVAYPSVKDFNWIINKFIRIDIFLLDRNYFHLYVYRPDAVFINFTQTCIGLGMVEIGPNDIFVVSYVSLILLNEEHDLLLHIFEFSPTNNDLSSLVETGPMFWGEFCKFTISL